MPAQPVEAGGNEAKAKWRAPQEAPAPRGAEVNRTAKESRQFSNAVIIEGEAAKKLQRELAIGIQIRKAEKFDALADAGAALLLEADNGDEIEGVQQSVDVIRALPEQLKTKEGRDMVQAHALKLITRKGGLRERAQALVDRATGNEVTAIRPNPLRAVESGDLPAEGTAVVEPLTYEKRARSARLG